MVAPPIVKKLDQWPPSLIKRLRGKRTQVEFGELLGVPKNTVWRWEAGHSSPNQAHLNRLSQIATGEGFFEWKLLGSVQILSDLEAGSEEIRQEVEHSVERSARLLPAED